MFWYIFIFILCLAGFILNEFYIKEEKHKNIINIFLIVILCLTTGTRYNIGGYDYDVYKHIFETVPELLDFNILTVHDNYQVFGMEKGFLFLCSFIKTIGFTYYSFNLICSIIFYICLYKGLKPYTKGFNIMLLIFLYKIFIFETFVLTRQMLCIGGFLILIKYIKKGEFWKYLVGCLLLTTIHTSSLLLILVYFVRYLKLTKKLLIILTLVFVPTTIFSLLDISIFTLIFNVLSFLPVVGVKFSFYAKYFDTTRAVNILNTLEYLVLMIWIIYRYKDLVKDENNQLFIKIFLFILPLVTLLRGYEIMARVKDYFVVSYFVLVPALLNLKRVIIKFKVKPIKIKNYKVDLSKYKIKFNNLVLNSIIIAMCFAGYIRQVANFGSGNLLPYDSYINEDIKFVDFGG